MQQSHFDIIIVGQGISGTVLSSALMEQHQKVLVIDDGNKKAASKIASGVINPVTGRRIVKTWQIDAVMPAAVRIYKALENKLNTQIIQQCNIVNFHASEQMQKAFADRIAEDPSYLSTPPLSNTISAAFDAPFGHTVIDPCWLIDVENLLHHWRQYLTEQHALVEDVFDFNKDAKGHNPLCGDNVHVYLKLNGQKIVEDISFEGSGCAISMASASIMTDLIKGKNEHEAKEIVEDFLGMIKENPKLNSENLKEDEKTKLMCLSGVKKYPMRVKCATLSWHTLVSAIDNTQEEINTEKLD